MRADLLRLLLVVVAWGLASLGGVGILVTGIEREAGMAKAAVDPAKLRL
ncbi:hypothetical protein [Streptomyces sp. WAC00263]|nr:hypothetical protein [Streptomyces sp. WAC00263]